jgi:hypothetical protein
VFFILFSSFNNLVAKDGRMHALIKGMCCKKLYFERLKPRPAILVDQLKESPSATFAVFFGSLVLD